MATTCAHEVGHYLGLYHTTELDGEDVDPISDTPDCGTTTAACAATMNLMYPIGGAARQALTAGQGMVLRRHPLCRTMPAMPE
jgi:hypothetical protein